MVLWKEINLAKMTFMNWKGLVHLFKSQGFDVAVPSQSTHYPWNSRPSSSVERLLEDNVSL